MGMQELFSVLTGQNYQPEAGVDMTPVTPASAPIQQMQQPQLADALGTAPAPKEMGWLDKPGNREQLDTIFAALAGGDPNNSGTGQLGAALTAGSAAKKARLEQDKTDARKKVVEGQQDAKANLDIETGRYNLAKAKKVDPIALKTAELGYQTAQTDSERKKFEFELFQLYGAKEYEAKLKKLNAEAGKAVTDAGKSAKDFKAENAPWGTEEHMGAMRRNASVVRSFTQMMTDPTTGLLVPGAFNEEAFQNWYDAQQGQYPTAEEVKKGAKPGKKAPAVAPTKVRTEADFIKYATDKKLKDPEAAGKAAYQKYLATQTK